MAGKATFERYRNAGLRTIPLAGKKPLVKWRGVRGDERWEDSHPEAGIGLLNDQVTVVDIDDLAFVDDARAVFGDTPIEVRTRKGWHLWYRSSGETRLIRPFDDGSPIDILGNGGYTVVPDSDGYTFAKGDIDAVADLPRIPTDVLRALMRKGAAQRRETCEQPPAPTPIPDWASMRDRSGRHKALFQKGGRVARQVADQGELHAQLLELNTTFGEPLPLAEVHDMARDLWRYREEGRLFVGGGAAIIFPHECYDALRGNPDAIALFSELKRQHNWRRTEFVLANRLAGSIGLSRRKFVRAVSRLADSGLLQITNPGGRGEGDVRRVRLLV